MSISAPAAAEPVSVLHSGAGPDSTWSTTNLAESIPGVPTPLCWSIWAPAAELAVRRTMQAIGALSREEAVVPPRPEDRLLGIFYGRAAIRVDLICEWIERVPGSDPVDVSMGAFSAVPEGYVSRSQPRYYPRVAARALTPFFASPRLIREQRPVAESFRNQALRALPNCEPAAARKWLADGRALWLEGLFRNTLITMGTIQPVIDGLTELTAKVGLSAQELMAGYGGHEETAVVMDAWACARDAMSVDEFVDRHGYHGWHEGEISSVAWREERKPVLDFIAGYAARPESEDPALSERERVERRHRLEAGFLAALPAVQRPVAIADAAGRAVRAAARGREGDVPHGTRRGPGGRAAARRAARGAR